MREGFSQYEKEMIGRGVRQAREQKGLTREEVVRGTYYSQDYLANLEEGQAPWIRIDFLRYLARLLSRGNYRGLSPGQVEVLTPEDIIEIFLPQLPEQLQMEMKFDDRIES